MKISVIMPCHNVGEYVEEALHSVAEQTYPPHEIICINDASTDDTVDRLRRTGIDIRLIDADCRNAAAARNRGAAIATGDWLAFHDADDIWLPTHLARAVEMLEQGDAVAHYGKHGQLLPSGCRCDVTPFEPDDGSPLHALRAEQCYRLFIHGPHALATPGFVVNHSRFDEVCGFDEQQRRRHDIELFHRLVHEHRWSYCPDVCWYHRLGRPGSITSNIAECFYYLLRAALKLRDEIGDLPDLNEKVRRCARGAASTALFHGNANDRRLAHTLAFPELSSRDWCVLRLAYCAPSVARMLRTMTKRDEGAPR